MIIITKNISIPELSEMAKKMFGNLVKAVVDIDRGVMAINGELHADEEALLIENGSDQKYLWGINIYPELSGDDFIEFDSMINLRPSSGNRGRGVDDELTRKRILAIADRLITK